MINKDANNLVNFILYIYSFFIGLKSSIKKVIYDFLEFYRFV